MIQLKNFRLLGFALLASFAFTACNDDENSDVNPVVEVEAPQTYKFERNGESTVSYDGQTTRIKMGNEFDDALTNNSLTEDVLMSMYTHQEGNDDFSDPELNASDKNMRSKTAASTDYYSANTTDATAIKAQFDEWISGQANEVFPNWDQIAEPGVAGQLQQAGGGSVRYLSAKGLEYNQAILKGTIGALMGDQMLNNYLSPAVLDAGDNVENNDNDVTEDGKNYTTMEHKWDEAFGYLYGVDDQENPQYGKDSFLNKYLIQVDEDPDFAGTADATYDAFKLGRAAIVAKDYELRDEQAEIIQKEISQVIAVRAIYYMIRGKNLFDTDKANALHQLSEGYGFIYSLQFTRKPGTEEPYFTKAEVEGFLDQLMEGDGFWDVTPETLDAIAEQIAARFDFTVEQAAP